MAYSGNVRPTGSARVALIGAPASITENSGQVASIVDNGVGDVTLTMDTERRYSPRATFTVQAFGAVAAITQTIVNAAGLTLQVLLFDQAGVAVDADFMLTINDVFIG